MKRVLFLLLLMCLTVNHTLVAEQISEERYDSLAYLFMQDDLLREDDSIVRKRLQIRRVQFATTPYESLLQYNINKSLNHNSEINKILVIVEKNIYESIGNYIQRYAHDIHNAYGCAVKVFSLQGGTFLQLKQLIISNKESLNGVVLVGNIIQANYHINEAYTLLDDFHWQASTFPCDLYYMDLDGRWNDSDEDGNLDEHTTNVAPEIFIGRIPTNHLSNPISNLKCFFDRDHAYWIGDKIVNQKYGLTFTGPDWHNRTFIESIAPLYGEYDFYMVGADSFNSKHYISCLQNPCYEFIQLACHSNYNYHAFDTITNDYLFRSGLANINKNALGYNLYCCSACDWSQDQLCMGQGYLLQPNSQTLALVGSTKTGGMLGFSDFYTPLGQGKCIGEAFKSWWINHCGTTSHSKREKLWFYGMCILGDPLVNFRYSSTCQDELILNKIETNNAEYRAQNKIIVQTYVIPDGKRVSICAPEIEIQGPFICTENAIFSTEEVGCIDRTHSASIKKSQERTIEQDNKPDVSVGQMAACWICPNPADRFINVVVQEDISSVRIYDISGQCMLQSSVSEIDVSYLRSGMYVIHCTATSGKIYQQTFIKQ